MLIRLLVGLADFSRRNALAVIIAGALLAAFSGWMAMHHLGVSTDTDVMFAQSLPWRQRAIEFRKDFPQFEDLLVAVINAREPEEADATAAELAAAPRRRPCAFQHGHAGQTPRPSCGRRGCCSWTKQPLTDLMNRTIDAQPFLGQLVADPTARGLFSALALLGMGVTHGGVDLTPYLGPMHSFHQAMADALAGHPQPLSWQKLLGGGLSDLAGQYRFVLVQPKLDYGALAARRRGDPGDARRHRAAPFVKDGAARVRHHRPDRAGRRGIRHRRARRGRRPDRQRGADHAVAVSWRCDPGG